MIGTGPERSYFSHGSVGTSRGGALSSSRMYDVPTSNGIISKRREKSGRRNPVNSNTCCLVKLSYQERVGVSCPLIHPAPSSRRSVATTTDGRETRCALTIVEKKTLVRQELGTMRSSHRESCYLAVFRRRRDGISSVLIGHWKN